jgi:hypothetical protein
MKCMAVPLAALGVLFAMVSCTDDVYVLSDDDAAGGHGGAATGSGAMGGGSPPTISAGGSPPEPLCGPEATHCFCGEMESCDCGAPMHCDMYCGAGCFLMCTAGGSCAMHCDTCDAYCDVFSMCTMECLGGCTLSCAPGAICEVLPAPGFVMVNCAENATCFCNDPGGCACEGEGCVAPSP